MRIRRTRIVLSVLLTPALAWAQHQHHQPSDIQQNAFLNLTEVVTGLAAAVVAFQAALAYREGRLGKGMTWVAVGMIIMSVGHLILAVKRMVGVDPLALFGPSGGFVVFSIAVFASFVSSAFGFWLVRRASGGE